MLPQPEPPGDVAGHADDLARLAAADREVAADRVLARHVLADEGLADDGDRRRAAAIGIGEGAPPPHGDAQRREVARSHVGHVGDLGLPGAGRAVEALEIQVQPPLVGEAEGHRGGLDVRQPLDPLEALREQPAHPAVRGVAGVLEGERGGDGVGAVESRGDAPEVEQGADQHPRQHEQDDAEGDLAPHQQAARPALPAAGGPRALGEHRAEIDRARAQRRKEPEEQDGEQGEGRRHPHHAGVELDRPRQGEAAGGEPVEGLDAERSEGDAGRAAQQGQDEALGQELAHDGRASAAQGGPGGHLPRPGGGAGEQQPGDVQAADHQHQPDGAPEEEQRLAEVERQRALQGHEGRGGPRPRRGIGDAPGPRRSSLRSRPPRRPDRRPDAAGPRSRSCCRPPRRTPRGAAASRGPR